MDFTLKIYRQLLDSLTAKGFHFQTFAEFLESPSSTVIILRHDVEAKYLHALEFAKIQYGLNLHGTYYFRFLPDHFDTGIIREIAAMGHEIGYHYDDLSHCKGNYEEAIKRFEKNLSILREIAPVKTICMEGAPLSKWDNRELWGHGESAVGGRQSAVSSQQALAENEDQEFKTQNSKLKTHYSAYGIIGEPYFDTDFSKVFYLTDTGRRWDGKRSIRDKINSKFQIPNSKQIQNSKFKIQNLKLRSTSDIIAAANAGLLPDQVMFTFHPQRWNDRPLPWVQELVMQNVKNVAKRWFLRR